MRIPSNYCPRTLGRYRATHEEEAENLAACGVEAVMERYWEACSVVVALLNAMVLR